MVAGQVVKSDCGEEILAPVDTTDLPNDKENNTASLPDYLPEEDSPVKVGWRPLLLFYIKYSL